MTIEDTEAKPRRHRWGEQLRLQDRTERACIYCRLVRITVHPPHGFPWQEWRHPDSDVRVQLSTTPPCQEARA